MKTLCLCLLILVVSCKQQDQSSIDVTVTKSSVINGETVTKEGEADLYNSAVSFMVGPASCSGVLIAKNIVLTAAHCMYEGKKPTSVWLGASLPYYREKRVGKNAYAVKEVIVHEKFVSDNKSDVFGYDLALIILKEDAKAPFKPIQIYDKLDFAQKGVPLYGAGMSIYSSGSRVSIYDLYTDTIKTKLEPSNVDQSANIKMLFRNVLVAGGLDDKEDFFYTTQAAGGICSGDSGGPTALKLGGELFLVGINHAAVEKNDLKFDEEGNKIDDCEFGGTATSVVIHKKWIQEKVKKYGAPSFIVSEAEPDAREFKCAQSLDYSFDTYRSLLNTDAEFCNKTASIDLEAHLKETAAECMESCSGLRGFAGQCEFYTRGLEQTIKHHNKACKEL